MSTNFIAKRFTEGTKNFEGTKTKSSRPGSKLLSNSQREYNTLMRIATENDIPITTVATRVLLNSIPDLAQYVMSKGEPPSSNPEKLALQAILLRADEIARVTRALDCDDADAVAEMMKAESDIIEINHPDSNHTLLPDTQACINVFLEEIRNKTGTVNNFISQINKYGGFNNFNTENILHGLVVPDHELIGSKSTGGSRMDNVSYPDNLFGPADVGGEEAEKKDFWGTLNDIIKGIGTTAGAVSGAVNDVKDASGGIIGAVKDLGGDVGSDAINKSIKKWAPYIIGIVIVIVIVIFIAIYANRRK